MFGGKAKLPMVIRTTVGGGKGYAGQHSQSLEAVVTQVPGLKVVAPSTAYDAKGLLKTAIRDDNPVIFIEHQLLYTEKGAVPGGASTRSRSARPRSAARAPTSPSSPTSRWRSSRRRPPSCWRRRASPSR